jgi:glycogen synthase
MKIALLSEKYTPDLGGLAISTGRLGDSLAAAGHDVRVFCPSPNLPATIKQTQRSDGVHVTRFGAHKRVDDTLVNWFEFIVEEHQREPFDLIHAYFLPMAGIRRRVCREVSERSQRRIHSRKRHRTRGFRSKSFRM